MSTIYTEQPFDVDLNYDLLPGTVTSVKIKYISPSKQAGEWVATLDEGNLLVYYHSAPTESLSDYSTKPNGTWKFWNYYICADGGEFPGEPVERIIYLEGKKAA